ncbi:MAG: hypothetical protein HY782_24290 [Chloroflexi bacterium]|nr:hypothetical protein [Chloroflexota bacterium]
MTHSLHRQGTCESLNTDYPVLAMVARQFDIVNDEAKTRTRDKLQAIFDVFQKHEPTNLGSLYVPGTRAHGVSDAKLRAGLKANGFVGAVFSDPEHVRDMLAELKERDYGISIIVSGLIEKVFGICDEVGLQPHTIDLALGVWGNKKLLPKAELMNITTMCGHALVAPSLIDDLVSQVKKGRLTAEQAAIELAKPCVCGIFNQKRAADLITELAK